VRVGMEATGYSRWFERLLAELGCELWMGHPAEIKAKRVKKQKTDRKDAELLLWGAGWRFGCTGCGETVTSIRHIQHVSWESLRITPARS
jgi:hypothetical protein